MSPSAPATTGRGPSIGFPDRLLAEAVRALERDGAQPIDEPRAEARATETGGDLEQRIAVRARSLGAADELEHSLRKTRQMIGVILGIAALLAAIAGASAAKASLASENDAPINIFWALGGLLGIQTLFLVLWFAVMLRGPSALAGASLGGVIVSVGRSLAGRWHKGAVNTAAVEATGVVLTRGSIGRWLLGTISNGLWVVFNLICLLLIVLMLSAKHYRFVWETTILSSETYTRMTNGLAWLPSRLGFPVPTPEQIAVSDGAVPPASRPEIDEEDMRHAWSGFFVGGLVIYGLGPRFLLLGLCVYRHRRARRRYRLDTTRPGYMRLQPRLDPRTESLGVIDPDAGGAQTPAPVEASPVEHHGVAGGPALFALEIDPPSSEWPPPVGGVSWQDLGFVDGRQDRERVLEQLGGSTAAPPIVVVVCGLTTTPDRGIASFLKQVRQAAGSPMALVLTGGDALRRRGNGEQVAGRVGDWRTLAGDVGLPDDQVLELDLDHLTDASAARLATLLGGNGTPPPARRIESAFELIVDHFGR